MIREISPYNTSQILTIIADNSELEGELIEFQKRALLEIRTREISLEEQVALEKEVSLEQIINQITLYANVFFRLIQNQAARDNLTVKVAAHFSSLPFIDLLPSPFKGTLLSQRFVYRLIASLFEEKDITTKFIKINKDAGVKKEAKKERLRWQFTWQTPNSHLIFKPICSTPSSPSPSFFAPYLESSEYSDIVLVVEGREIPAHKIILSQVGYFKTMFAGEWKETKSEIVNNIKYSIYHAMLEFCYKSEISPKFFESFSNLAGLFQLSDAYQFPALKAYCLPKFADFAEDNIVDIIFILETIPDSYLKDLCQWYFVKYPNFGSGLDYSTYSYSHLITLYQVGKEYYVEELVNRSLEELGARIQLDDHLTRICERIFDLKDSFLKNWVIEKLKTSDLYTSLNKERKETYPEQWRAVKQLLLDPSF